MGRAWPSTAPGQPACNQRACPPAYPAARGARSPLPVPQEAQPFFVNSPLGIYMIHNGNLTNTEQLRKLLNSSTSFFNRHLRTDSDSEVRRWRRRRRLCGGAGGGGHGVGWQPRG